MSWHYFALYYILEMVRGGKRCMKGKGCCGGLNWLQCGACGRFELYENCGMEGEYDEEKVKSVAFICRMCELEKMNAWKIDISGRMSVVELRLQGVYEKLAMIDLNVSGVKESSENAAKARCAVLET